MIEPVALAFDALGQGPPLVVLHGFLGAGENWRTVLKPYQERFTVYYLDQRNHGRSPHASPHTYPALVEDLHFFLTTQGIGSATFLGHSMGGKVGALFALRYPKRVERLIVVDMPLHSTTHSHQDILLAMAALERASLQTRNEAASFLEAQAIDSATAQFLLKSLERLPQGGFRWRVNLPLFLQDYAEITRGIDDSAGFFAGPTAFIRGSDSDYLTDQGLAAATRAFPGAQLFTVPRAGHWVHSANPSGFQAALTAFLATAG